GGAALRAGLFARVDFG
ncbi:hypothetical protein A2U01_0114752, partial [Trifolium medium]|nr:hypothetical protein [Trifolium medium]